MSLKPEAAWGVEAKEDTNIDLSVGGGIKMLPPIFILTVMKEDFTEYDIKPNEFLNYLRYYGPHFNKKLCEFACSNLPYKDCTKEKIESMLKSHGIQLDNAKMYDHVYVANWCKSVFYGSSIADEKHFVLFLKDVFDKEGDLVFNRWYADAAKRGIPVEWEEMI